MIRDRTPGRVSAGAATGSSIRSSLATASLRHGVSTRMAHYCRDASRSRWDLDRYSRLDRMRCRGMTEVRLSAAPSDMEAASVRAKMVFEPSAFRGVPRPRDTVRTRRSTRTPRIDETRPHASRSERRSRTHARKTPCAGTSHDGSVPSGHASLGRNGPDFRSARLGSDPLVVGARVGWRRFRRCLGPRSVRGACGRWTGLAIRRCRSSTPARLAQVRPSGTGR